MGYILMLLVATVVLATLLSFEMKGEKNHTKVISYVTGRVA